MRTSKTWDREMVSEGETQTMVYLSSAPLTSKRLSIPFRETICFLVQSYRMSMQFIF